MRVPLVILALAAAVLAIAAPAGARAPVQIQITHATHGCHTWAIGHGPAHPAQTIRVHAGTTFSITNNDVMSHTLVQLAGPKIAVSVSPMGHMAMRMGHVGASMQFTLRKPGTYRFMTKAGEDYPGVTVKTIGADNVLHLMVVVV